jgi:hypothetical protein
MFQVRYIVQWFGEWSEMQREDFVTILAQSLSANFCPVNGLSELGMRPPSLFQCRVKLFREWCLTWSEAERQALLDSLRESDTTFVQQVEDALKGLEGGKVNDLPTSELVATDPREGEVV